MRFSGTTFRCLIEALMQDVMLGDNTPSQLLKLKGHSKFDDGFLRQAFLRTLSILVQAALAVLFRQSSPSSY